MLSKGNRDGFRAVGRAEFGEDRVKSRRMLEFANVNRDVADPWYTGNFDATWDDVLAGCTALLQKMNGKGV